MARILVVEDDPQIARLVEFKLRHSGFQVTLAPDGGAGAQEVLDNPPDLVLLDVMMPVLNGYQVLERIRANPQTCDLPVIMVTAKGYESDLDRLRDNVTDYILKPFSPSDVVARIRGVLGE